MVVAGPDRSIAGGDVGVRRRAGFSCGRPNPLGSFAADLRAEDHDPPVVVLEPDSGELGQELPAEVRRAVRPGRL